MKETTGHKTSFNNEIGCQTEITVGDGDNERIDIVVQLSNCGRPDTLRGLTLKEAEELHHLLGEYLEERRVLCGG